MTFSDGDRRRGGEFLRVLRYYRRLHASLGEEDGGCYRFTELGAWAASRSAHVFHFFKLIGLEKCRLFIDLGSGDGLAACIAGLFTRSVGIEIDPGLASMAAAAATALQLQDRVSFVRANYLTQNIQRADCLYIYPDKPPHALGEILAGWGGMLLVYGPHLTPRGFTVQGAHRCGKERMISYRASAAG